MSGVLRKPVRVLPVLAAALLAGCFPNAATYYRPEAPGAVTLKGGKCTPVEEGIRLRSGAVEVIASYLPQAGQRKAGLFLYLESPPHHRIAFVSDAFDLREEPGGKPIPVRQLKVLRDDGRATLTEPYGRAEGPAAGKAAEGRRWYTVVVQTDDLGIDAFSMQMPSLAVDGAPVTFPRVQFRRTTWTGVSPLNC